MATSAAKSLYNHESIIDKQTVVPRKPGSGYPTFSNTEEDIIEQLNIGDFELRLKVLNKLRTTALENGQWFRKLRRKLDFFEALCRVLSAPNWEIQHQCIKFLADTMRDYGEDLEWCMAAIFPVLIPKLASAKITVRRMTIQAILAYLRTIKSAHSFLKIFIKCGLNDPAVNREVLRELPNLLVSDLAELDWSLLLSSLFQLLTECRQENADMTTLILDALDKMREIAGIAQFNEALSLLSPMQRNSYELALVTRGSRNAMMRLAGSSQHQVHVELPMCSGRGAAHGQVRYGVIPVAVCEQIAQSGDWRTRVAGLSQLKAVVDSLKEGDVMKLQQHLHSYVNMLTMVLDDVNFNVLRAALEALSSTVSKLKIYVQPQLSRVVAALSKHMGNQKSVVKQLNMTIVLDLMQAVQPKPVVTVLSTYLQHRSSQVREEVLNMLTAALLRFPQSEFNLSAIGCMIAPLLADPKRRVRLASFECAAVLAHALGSTKLELFYQCVRDTHRENDISGLLDAVQYRLARHQLPKVGYHGILEYSILADLHGKVQAPDVQWILGNNRDVGVTGAVGLPDAKQSDITLVNDYRPPLRKAVSADTDRLSVLAANLEKQAVREVQSYSAPLHPTREFAFHTSNAEGVNEKFARLANDKGAIANSSQVEKSLFQFGAQPQGKTVLSPLEHDDHARRRPAPDPLDYFSGDELSNSLDELKYSAMKKRNQQPPPQPMKRTHSFDQLNNTSYSWDEQPVKGASKYPEVSNAYSSPRRKSLGAKVKGIFKSSNGPSQSAPQQRQQAAQQRKVPVRPLARSQSQERRPVLTQQQVRRSTSGDNKKMEESNRPPEQQIDRALKKLATDEWTDKIDGINTIQSLAERKEEALRANLHAVTVALLNEAKNLRSSVSRQALACFNALFLNMGRNMDPEVDKLTVVLLNKAGDTSNAFIREDAQKALEFMVDSVSPTKTLSALLTTGASHKSATVRAACGQLVLRLTQNMGSNKVLSQRDVCDRVLPAAVQFTSDSQPQPRHFGKSILHYLSQDRDFENVVKRHYPDSLQRSIFNVVDSVNSKGLTGASSSYGASATLASATSSSSLQRNGSVKRPTKVPDHVQDATSSAHTLLTSSSWEDRYKGVREYLELAQRYPQAASNSVKTAEAYAGRLNDINSKVALEALQSCPTVLTSVGPLLNDSSKGVTTELVKNLMAQLPSKNDDIRHHTKRGLDACVKSIDNNHLMQSFAMATKSGNVKQKPDMLRLLGRMCQNVYPTRPKAVQTHALPVLWDLLKTKQGEPAVRQATVDFTQLLDRTLGRRVLLENASGLSTTQNAQLKELLQA